MALIEIKNLSKEYLLDKVTIKALNNVSLTIDRGEFLSITGRSGSGKTTLLNLIGLIDNPTSGEIIIDSQATMALNDKALTNMRLAKIGFIFQMFNLIPILNVTENVEFPLLLRNISKAERKEKQDKVQELISAVGLEQFKKHKPSELSGGQRQRVAIARALVTDPDIILADEPTANLDTKTSSTILDLMEKMNKVRGTTFIFSTHDPEVLSYAKRSVRLTDGAINNTKVKKKVSSKKN